MIKINNHLMISHMNRLLIAVACLFSQQLTAQTFNLSWIDRDAETRIGQFRALTGQNPLTSGFMPSGMDIRFHRLVLELDPSLRYVKGSVTTYFIPTQQTFSSIAFDMQNDLDVLAIRYHGGLLTGFIHQNNKLIITMPGQPQRGNPETETWIPDPGVVVPDSILIEYQGIPVDDGLGSFTLDKHNGVPILSTLSEPYGARNWWPCSQDLNDKIDSVELFITVPPGNRAAANGLLISEEHFSDRSVYHWKHRHPIAAYLVGISVTNYATYSDYVPLANGDSIEVLNYVYPETLANTRIHTRDVIRQVQLYNRLFGLYPFADERYGHAQWSIGGGMEHQTMTFLNSFDFELMAHELGHQWFGDFVTCGSWKDIWLNEGFATYLSGLCFEHEPGAFYWEPFKRLSINRVISQPGGSVYCPDTTNVNRIFDPRLSYSKGAMVLHMLRWEMGDSLFFRALNNYLYDPGLSNGFATTKDLIRHVEAVADTSFREFFNDWVYGAGYPKYQIIYRVNPGNEIELEISQETSDPSVGFFQMHLPIRLYGKGASSSGSVTVVVHHTSNNQIFRFRPGFAVDSLKFDPDRWICTGNPIILDVNEIPYNQQVKIFPNPVSDQLTIQLALPEKDLTIRLYNQKGQLIKEVITSYSSTRILLPMNSYPDGLYSVEVGSRKAVTVVKRAAH